MTIRSKRAKALRKMDRDEAGGYVTGGWVDEAFPADAVHSALAPVADRIDIPAFDEFLGPRLGLYRDMSESQQQQPSVDKELSLIEEAMQFISQLQLRLDHLPPASEGHIAYVCWKRRGEMFDDFRSRLDADLKETLVLLGLTERQLDTPKGKPGRKPASLRDSLLHDVAHWLQDRGIGKEAAAIIAADVLRAVGIVAPREPRKARKLVLQWERQRAENTR